MPEGIVDVIPVDLVVAAIIAVAAAGPPTPTSPDVVQVASGSANPLRYRRLVDLVQRLVHASTRSTTPTASPSSCPSGASPAAAGCRASSSGPRTLLERAEKVLGALPLRGKQAEWSRHARGAARGGRAGARLRRALRRLRRVRGDLRRRPPARPAGTRSTAEDQARLLLRPPGRSTGTATSTEIHLPSVVEHARVAHHAGRPHRASPRRPAARARCSSPDRHLAAFDLENTLIASNVVASLLVAGHPPARRATTGCGSSPRRSREAPGAARRSTASDRSDFLRSFYRRYEGAPVEQIDEDAAEMFSAAASSTKSFPAAIRRVREHRRARPPHGAHHRRARLRGRAAAPAVRRHRVRPSSASATDGTLHRRADDVPPTGESPGPGADRLRRRRTASTCAESVAYADSTSDLPMLEAVGFPVAVNPETRLAALARKRGWLVEHWSQGRRARRGRSLPIGPRAPQAAAWPTRWSTRAGRAMKALRFERKLAAVRRRHGRRRGSCPARGATVGPLRLARRRPARAARPRTGCASGPGWPASAAPTWPPSTARSSATSSRSCRSRSCPGHEVVADLDDGDAAVVLEPVLGCVDPRHRPVVRRLRRGATSATASASPSAHLEPGLQTGFCCDTGGGWSTPHGRPREPAPRRARRHERRGRGDGRAHRLRGARRARAPASSRRAPSSCSAPARSACSRSPRSAATPRPARSSPSAKHPEQRALARRSAPTSVVEPGELGRAVRRAHRLAGARRRRHDASPAAPTSSSTASAARPASTAGLAVVRPGGQHHHGRHARPRRTSTSPALWQREIALPAPTPTAPRRRRRRARAPSTSPSSSSRRPTSAASVSATYPLARYTDAIEHAANAGARGAVKIAFDLRNEKERHPCLRPGFVLDVDRSTPPILFHHGERFRLEKLPAGRSGSSTRPSRSSR